MCVQIDAACHVVLKLPQRQRESRGLAFMESHSIWICEMLSSRPKILPLRDYLRKNPQLSIGGKWVPTEVNLSRSRAAYELFERPSRVWIQLDRRVEMESQLLDVLRRLASEVLPERVAHLSQRVRITVHGVRVRDQRGRWGSCSETGGLSLNWRLILLPPALQDHIIFHELAHLRYFDHSKDFHACLKSFDPLSEEHSRWLNDEGDFIFNLGRLK